MSEAEKLIDSYLDETGDKDDKSNPFKKKKKNGENDKKKKPPFGKDDDGDEA